MKSIFITIICTCFIIPHMFSQGEMQGTSGVAPYYEIPAYPENYTAATVAARMIDGLGYRYYWATAELREEDLDYKPSEDSRTSRETLDHLLGLSETILNGSRKQANIRPANRPEMSFDEKRVQTLENLAEASKLLKARPDQNLEENMMVFQRGENKTEFPYWNMINGPIADALYHTGQIVAFRRASGNPINPNVNVLRGKNRE